MAASERQAVVANPEEIELDMDFDTEDEGGKVATPAAPSMPNTNLVPTNPEEIELDFEDIEEQPIPQEVFGGSLSSIRATVSEQTEEVEEPPLAEPAAQSDSQSGSRPMGALARSQRKGKGKG